MHTTLPILKAQIYKAETLLLAVFKNRYRRRRLQRGGCCVVVKGYKATFTQRCSIATKLTWIFQERTSTKSSAQQRQGENNFFSAKLLSKWKTGNLCRGSRKKNFSYRSFSLEAGCGRQGEDEVYEF